MPTESLRLPTCVRKATSVELAQIETFGYHSPGALPTGRSATAWRTAVPCEPIMFDTSICEPYVAGPKLSVHTRYLRSHTKACTQRVC
jgi:hypothetical protein